MLKKLLLILLLIPTDAFTWEASVGIGYYGRKFNQSDNLGAYQGYMYATPDHTNGGSLNTTFLFDINENFRLGADSMFNYGQHSVQETFLNFKSYQTWSYIAAPTIQYHKEDFIIAFKPGFIVNGMTGDYKHRVDIDTSFSFALRISAPIFSSQRIFFEPQMVIAPSTGNLYAPVASPAIVVGIEQIFVPKQKVIELPKEPTVVKLPEPETPVDIPALPTVVTATNTESPKKMVLKFNENNLDADSTDFLQNILNIHNRIPSVITVYYANSESAKTKADVLYNWFTSHGAIKEEVILLNGLKAVSYTHLTLPTILLV